MFHKCSKVEGAVASNGLFRLGFHVEGQPDPIEFVLLAEAIPNLRRLLDDLETALRQQAH